MKSSNAETKLFTPVTAEKMLPLVRSIVSDIVRDYKTLRGKVEILSERKRDLPPDADRSKIEARDALELEVDALSRKVDSYLAEINELGVELKDYENGLCDFPARMDGEIVYLCWRLGEDHIDYWHSVESGFAGRQPIVRDPEVETEADPE